MIDANELTEGQQIYYFAGDPPEGGGWYAPCTVVRAKPGWAFVQVHFPADPPGKSFPVRLAKCRLEAPEFTLEGIASELASLGARYGGDFECIHSHADELLLTALRLFGQAAGKEAEAARIISNWQACGKWYA